MDELILDTMPSFIGRSSFRLISVDGSWNLDIRRLPFSQDGDPAASWTYSLSESHPVSEIIALADQVMDERRDDPRMILDGINLRLTLTTGAATRVHEFRCPEVGTAELELSLQILKLADQLAEDPALTDYLELLEQYFEGGRCMRMFDEEPMRLRIFGSLSFRELSEARDVFSKLSRLDSLVVDMRNFTGMGTILDPHFQQLRRVGDLRFLTNDAAVKALRRMGFQD